MHKRNRDSYQELIEVIFFLIFLEHLEITEQIFSGTWLQELKPAFGLVVVYTRFMVTKYILGI